MRRRSRKTHKKEQKVYRRYHAGGNLHPGMLFLNRILSESGYFR